MSFELIIESQKLTIRDLDILLKVAVPTELLQNLKTMAGWQAVPAGQLDLVEQVTVECVNALKEAIQTLPEKVDYDRVQGMKQKAGEDPMDYLDRLRDSFRLHSKLSEDAIKLPLKYVYMNGFSPKL